jgi:hypothetical protein
MIVKIKIVEVTIVLLKHKLNRVVVCNSRVVLQKSTESYECVSI